MSDSADETSQHALWMNEAITLARAGMREHGGGPFGAVVVADGKVVGRGWNQVTSLLDPTAHAEVSAIRDACRNLKRFELRGCSLPMIQLPTAAAADLFSDWSANPDKIPY